MPIRPAVIVLVALLHGVVTVNTAEAQRQRFKLGGGAGFAFLSDAEHDLGSTASAGGFFGFRFNDHVSLESGLFYVHVNRVFNIVGVPVDQTPDTPSYRFATTRYQLDGTLVVYPGRRQPFHPFFLVGAGLRRRENQRTNFTFETNPETGQPVLVGEDIVLDESIYEPTLTLGAGAEIYFMYNLAARAEWRWWFPKDWDSRTSMLYFAATYFF